MINLLMCSVCMASMQGGHDPQPHHISTVRDVVHVRTSIPKPWSDQLDHLGIELGVSKSRLIQEGAILVLRYHGRAAGVPEPLPPVGGSK